VANIYYIDNHKNWKGYVGCTKNTLPKRFGQHRYLLRRGMHPNAQLQHDWDQHGERAFSIMLLEACEDKDMFARERYHIERLGTSDPALGYNQ
jgi:group I intron endonuclease